MDNDSDTNDGYENEEPAAKIRRINRACLHCRSRKQRCPPAAPNAGLRAPCQRCRQMNLRCSFELGPTPDPEMGLGSMKIEEYVYNIQKRLNEHERRILELETISKPDGPEVRAEIVVARNNGSGFTVPSPSQRNGGQADETKSYSSQTGQPRPNPTVADLELVSPFQTLRSMEALSKDKAADGSTPIETSPELSRGSEHDPISCGIITSEEVVRAVELYFEHFHAHAPFVQERFRTNPLGLRDASPSVLLAMCTISARFWTSSSSGSESLVFWHCHPRISDLIALFDAAVSRLLIRPLPSDVCLDSVQALLLYAQWMPSNWAEARNGSIDTLAPNSVSKGRYNDVSAWAVLGLAARYALVLKLHHETRHAPDLAAPSGMTYDQTARLRTLCNLSTCDFNLMLSSGLPVSIDPGNIARNISNFASQANSQHPGDLRYTALIELVSLTYQALKGSGDLSGRKLTSNSLATLNADFDNWERMWASRLKRTRFQHTQLPFTSVRWYRLSLNSAAMNAYISSNERIDPSQPQHVFTQPLGTSITAAAQMVLCHAKSASDFIWNFQSQDRSTFPQGPLQVDIESLKRLLCAVDSTWISYTFAITFLVLCYFKNIIDDNIQYCRNEPSFSPGLYHPMRPRPDSMIARLLCLALDTSEKICNSSRICAGQNFKEIIQTATSLIGIPNTSFSDSGATPAQVPMQSFLDLMHDSGLDWPAAILDWEAFTDG